MNRNGNQQVVSCKVELQAYFLLETSRWAQVLVLASVPMLGTSSGVCLGFGQSQACCFPSLPVFRHQSSHLTLGKKMYARPKDKAVTCTPLLARFIPVVFSGSCRHDLCHVSGRLWCSMVQDWTRQLFRKNRKERKSKLQMS